MTFDKASTAEVAGERGLKYLEGSLSRTQSSLPSFQKKHISVQTMKLPEARELAVGEGRVRRQEPQE